jgi:cell fate regulator YaaT (PSP1 superfamily)
LNAFLTIFGKPRYLGVVDLPESAAPLKNRWIFVQTSRGEELALVIGPLTSEQIERYRTQRRIEDRENATPRGNEQGLEEITFVADATDTALALREEHQAEETHVLVTARQLLREHNLSMKLVDVEYLLDKKKLFLYFTSEQRVDFRAYVRDLAKEFKTRIELRQIGVRDEAKVLGGISPCGLPCCCSSWLNGFSPICIRMVKEQNLALNPTKISGICGRLMCCMAYEHATYRELWEHLPNPGSKIRAPQTTYIVTGVDIKARAVRICGQGIREFEVPVDDFPAFKECVLRGNEWITEDSPSQEASRVPHTFPENAKHQRFTRASTSSTEEKPHSVKERTSSERGTASPSPMPEEKEPKRGKTSFSGGTESSDSIPEKPKKTRRRRKKNASAKQEEGKERVISPRTQQEEKSAPLEENKNPARPTAGKRHADSVEHSPRTSREEQALKRTPPDGEGEQKQKTRRRRRPKRKPQQIASSPSEENRSAEKPNRTTVDATSKG